MTQLGGHAHFLDADVTQISHGETPSDTGKILAAMGHGICVRHDLVLGEGNKYMREMAAACNVPIINMQCDVDHPTQTLADIMTIREHFGKDNVKGLKIAVTWGTPTPVTILVVQIEPGPIPTLTTSAPAPARASQASAVATLPATSTRSG